MPGVDRLQLPNFSLNTVLATQALHWEPTVAPVSQLNLSVVQQCEAPSYYSVADVHEY